MEKEKFEKWLRTVNTVTDQLERVAQDPLQHLTQEQRDNYFLDVLQATDEATGSNLVERWKAAEKDEAKRWDIFRRVIGACRKKTQIQ